VLPGWGCWIHDVEVSHGDTYVSTCGHLLLRKGIVLEVGSEHTLDLINRLPLSVAILLVMLYTCSGLTILGKVTGPALVVAGNGLAPERVESFTVGLDLGLKLLTSSRLPSQAESLA